MGFLHIQAVRRAEPSDLSAFNVKVKPIDADPCFVVSDGVVWKSACWICIYDDGHLYAQLYSHLRDPEMQIAYGLIEEAFTGGQAKSRREKWERCRRNKNRKQGYYRQHYYVRADTTDPHAQVVMAAAGMDTYDKEASEALGIDREVAQ